VEALPSCIEPTALSASGISYTTATLSWTAPSTGTPVGYEWEVRSSGAAGSGATGLAASGITTTPTVTASATGLTGATTYTLYVRTDCGSSSYSAWASNTFTTLSCNLATGLAVSAITTTTATITWVAPAIGSPTGYEWEVRSSGAAGSGATGLASSGSTTSPTVTANVTGLTVASTYSVFVRTTCSVGFYSAWTSAVVFNTACLPTTTFPYTQDFNGITPPALPPCFEANNANADGDKWITYTTYGVGGTNCAGLYTDFNSGLNNDFLILPYFTLNGNQRLKFSVRAMSAGEPNDYKVVLSTTDNSPASFTTVLQPLTTVSSTIMTEVSWINLSAYTGNVYIAIQVPSGGLDGYYLYVDDIIIDNLPSCVEPSGLVASSITSTSATISWTASSSSPSAGYEYEVRTSGAAGSGATGLVANGTTAAAIVTANISGLTPNTSYSFYVRANCGSSNFSTWAGTGTFYTGYCVASSTLTSSYTNNFSTSNGSTNISNLTSGFATGGYQDATSMIVSMYAGGSVTFTAGFIGTTVGFNIWVDWNKDLDFDDSGEKVYASGGYVSSATGTIAVPVGTSNDTYRMRIRCDYNASNPNACGSGSGANETEDYTFTVVAPPACPVPTTLTAIPAGFQATLGWTEAGTATLWDIEWGTSGYTYTGTPTITGITNPYILTGLTPSTGYTYKVRANCGSSTSTWAGPKTFTTTVACPAPTTLTATPLATDKAELNWTETGAATTWDIEYGASGFTPTGTPNIPGVSSKPYALTGLSAGTAYAYYVRANCGGAAATSTWSGPTTFTTLCNVFVPDYSQNFSTYSGVSGSTVCWDEADAGTPAAGFTSLGTSLWANDQFGNTGTNNCAKVNMYSNTKQDWLISPHFNLSAGGYQAVFDIALTAFGATTSSTMGSDDQVIFLISTNGGSTWSALQTWDATSTISNTGQTITIPLTSYTQSDVMFAFWANEGTVNDASDYDFFVDNFKVQFPPACPNPSSLSATAITAVGASIGWTGATNVQIEYGSVGHTAGTGTNIGTVSTNPYILTTLTAATTYEVYVRQDCGSSSYSAWIGPVTFTTLCNAATTVNENFDAVTTPALPTCWNKLGTGSASTSTSNSSSSPNSLFMYADSYYGDEELVVLPPVSNAGAGTHQLRFKLRSSYYIGEQLEVGYMSDRTNISTFVAVSIEYASSSSFVEKIVQMGTAPGSATALAIKLTGYDGDAVYIDDVVWEAIPTCFAPTLLVASAITQTTATISWTAPSTPPSNGYQWEVRTSGAAGSGATGLAASGTTAAGIVTANVTTGLSASNVYNFYVRGVCTVGDYSAWAAGSFNSACVNFTLNVVEGFNTSGTAVNPLCWTQQNVVGTSALSYQTSSSYPTTTPQEGTRFVFWNSFDAGWPSGNETRLVSPPITTTGTSSIDVDFNWYNNNRSLYSTGNYLLEGVQVQYSLDGTNWVDAGSFIPRHDGTLASGTGAWNLKQVTLPAEAGNKPTVFVGFKFHSSYGYNCSMDNVTIKPTPVLTKTLTLKVFLEGPFNGTDMETTLNTNTLIPLASPYGGTETVTTVPAGVVDWVSVELRDATAPELADPTTTLTGWPKAYFVKADGSIVDLDGTSLPDIGNPTVTNNLYVVVRHRNHIAVMSANGMILTGGTTYVYDFSTSLSQAFNGSAGYKELGASSGIFGMVSGDADATGDVSVIDFDVWATDFGQTSVYLQTDIDLDSEISVIDFDKWATNFGVSNPVLGASKHFKYRSQVPVNKVQ